MAPGPSSSPTSVTQPRNSSTTPNNNADYADSSHHADATALAVFEYASDASVSPSDAYHNGDADNHYDGSDAGKDYAGSDSDNDSTGECDTGEFPYIEIQLRGLKQTFGCRKSHPNKCMLFRVTTPHDYIPYDLYVFPEIWKFQVLEPVFGYTLCE